MLQICTNDFTRGEDDIVVSGTELHREEQSYRGNNEFKPVIDFGPMCD